MSTYRHLVERFNGKVHKLVKFSGLEEHLVENIIRFCQCLTKPREESIDLQIYLLVLSTYFDFVDQSSAVLTYNRIAKNRYDGQITIDDFSKLICVFFSENLDIKIEHVFTLYDYNNDGFIDRKKVSVFMRGSWCISDVDDADKDETYIDMCNMASDCLGLELGAGGINLEQFGAKVKENQLMLSILCPSLPVFDAIERFRDQITGKSNLEMKETFRNVRSELLYEPIEERSYYPILLDLP